MSSGYDSVELRRRIAVCFSISELQKLADSLGFADAVPLDRGVQEASTMGGPEGGPPNPPRSANSAQQTVLEAAGELVRRAERYAGLDLLVQKLREAKPLVEWPEPTAAPAKPIPPTIAGMPAFEAMGASPPAGSAPVPPALGASPGSFGPSPAVASAPAAPPPPSSSAPAAAPASAPAANPWITTAGGGYLPQQAPQQASAPRGFDGRILIAVAGLTVVAAVIAYLAGRATSGGGADANAASPAGTGTVARRPDGPALRAADAMARSLTHVARMCEMPGGVAPTRDVFRRAYERCGPAPVQRPNAPPTPYIPPAYDPPSADDPKPDPPPAPRDQAPPKARKDKPPADDKAPGGGAGCLPLCDQKHRSCKSQCGPEPTESSRYDVYNKCLSGCMSDFSRCRLTCR